MIRLIYRPKPKNQRMQVERRFGSLAKGLCSLKVDIFSALWVFVLVIDNFPVIALFFEGEGDAASAGSVVSLGLRGVDIEADHKIYGCLLV